MILPPKDVKAKCEIRLNCSDGL